MKLYNETSGTYERLANMYPSYYRDVYEMQEILKAQGKLADGLISGIEQIFFNQFIDYADESVISSFEEKLGISPDTSSGLEERRRIVKAYLIGGGKVSISVIKEMISAYTGSGVSFDFSITDGGGNRTLSMVIERGENGFFNLKDIYSLLSTKLPAHIAYALRVVIRRKIEFVYNYKFFSAALPKCGEFNCGEEVLICF